MAKKQTVRIRPSTLWGDLHAYTALKSLADYVPANPVYTQQAAVSIMEAMKNAQIAELNAQNALAAARDAAAAAEWDFHNTMLAVKEQVIAQFGKSSDQVQSLGLKKKTEYKTPARKAKSA